MNLNCVEFNDQENHISAFIELAHRLYPKNKLMQNDRELRQLLTDTHLLSGDFKLHKFCIYDDDQIVGRFAFTIYPADTVAYFGFFECVNDTTIAKFLFDKANQFANQSGIAKIVGPLDASFWLKYRLKINHFDDAPYTGEPYNLPYYFDLFKANGFVVKDHYISSVYKKLNSSYNNAAFTNILNDFRKKGYTIESPNFDYWDDIVKDVYQLITDLYSDFPTFKPISFASFEKIFADYKKIIDPKMAKIAYYQGKAVGFYISVPDYGNTVYLNHNLINIIKILKRRFWAPTYVMLYIGAKREHKGVGSAMIGAIIEALKKNKRSSIGALQRDGNKSQSYLNELIEKRYEYVLLEKAVK